MLLQTNFMTTNRIFGTVFQYRDNIEIISTTRTNISDKRSSEIQFKIHSFSKMKIQVTDLMLKFRRCLYRRNRILQIINSQSISRFANMLKENILQLKARNIGKKFTVYLNLTGDALIANSVKDSKEPYQSMLSLTQPLRDILMKH